MGQPRILVVLLIFLLLPNLLWAGTSVNPETGRLDLTGTDVQQTDCSTITTEGTLCWDTDNDTFCIGTGSACASVGGGGNSFETISTPAGTSPVADSTTDTLTITETSFLTITGTAGTDTIDITQVTTDLGTDGLIAANAVALGTDTTNNYVATVADDGTGTVTVVGSGSETAAVTLKVIDVSCTNCLGATEVASDALLWNEIGDPSGDGTVAFGTTQQTISSTLNGGSVMVVTDTTADVTTDTWLLDLKHADNLDTNALFIRGINDSDGTPSTVFEVGVDGHVGIGTTVSPDGITHLVVESGDITGTAFALWDSGAGANVGRWNFRSAPDFTIEKTNDAEGVTATLFDIEWTSQNITLGSAIDLTAMVGIDGNADEIQLKVQGNATQTSSLLVLEQSDGTDVLDVSNAGILTLNGTATIKYDSTRTDLATNEDLILEQANPSICWRDTTDNVAYCWHLDTAEVPAGFVLHQGTDTGSGFATNAALLRASGSQLYLPHLPNCNTLDTDASGKLACGTDEGGAGSGDITDVYNCASGDCNSIVMADGDLLNGSSVNPNTTSEGLIFPQNTTCTANTAEGQVCWDTDDNALRIGDGATTTSFGADTNADKEFLWPMAALLPLEAAESIPPIVKDAGTTLDQMTVDFDQSTDECRTFNFLVPPDMTAGGTVTFTVVWYSASVTTNNVIWYVTQNGGVAEGVDPDASSTTETAAADAVQGTAGQVTFTTWTQTTTNLNWAASDLVEGVVCRDANNVSDNFAADAKAVVFGIRVPRS